MMSSPPLSSDLLLFDSSTSISSETSGSSGDQNLLDSSLSFLPAPNNPNEFLPQTYHAESSSSSDIDTLDISNNTSWSDPLHPDGKIGHTKLLKEILNVAEKFSSSQTFNQKDLSLDATLIVPLMREMFVKVFSAKNINECYAQILRKRQLTCLLEKPYLLKTFNLAMMQVLPLKKLSLFSIDEISQFFSVTESVSKAISHVSLRYFNGKVPIPKEFYSKPLKITSYIQKDTPPLVSISKYKMAIQSYLSSNFVECVKLLKDSIDLGYYRGYSALGAIYGNCLIDLNQIDKKQSIWSRAESVLIDGLKSGDPGCVLYYSFYLKCPFWLEISPDVVSKCREDLKSHLAQNPDDVFSVHLDMYIKLEEGSKNVDSACKALSKLSDLGNSKDIIAMGITCEFAFSHFKLFSLKEFNFLIEGFQSIIKFGFPVLQAKIALMGVLNVYDFSISEYYMNLAIQHGHPLAIKTCVECLNLIQEKSLHLDPKFPRIPLYILHSQQTLDLHPELVDFFLSKSNSIAGLRTAITIFEYFSQRNPLAKFTLGCLLKEYPQLAVKENEAMALIVEAELDGCKEASIFMQEYFGAK